MTSTVLWLVVLLCAFSTYPLVHGRVLSGHRDKSLLFKPETQPRTTSGPDTTCIIGTVCGDGFCCCFNSTASCVDQGLSFIPQLPRFVTVLDFTSNNLTSITAEALQNVWFLSELIINDNNVTTIHPDAFGSMSKLQQLHLARNHLTDFESLVSALAAAVSLEQLDLGNNHFTVVSFSVLATLKNLRNLTLNDNFIERVELGPLNWESGLQDLNLGTNVLAEFPDFCQQNDTMTSLLPQLRSLNIEWNKISDMRPQSPRCFPSLVTLNMDGNAIYRVQKNFLRGFPNLEILSLRFCMSRIIERHAFNHPHIKHLDVSENLWFFDRIHGPGIDPGLFLDMPELRSINMSWTVFRFSQDDEREQVLQSLRHVHMFSLEGTGLSFIPQTILSEFRNLTHLSFGKNEIAYLSDDTFENLTSLRVLDLDKNHLTTISQSLLQDVVSRDNVTLDLSGNPFSCTCDLLWFIEVYREDASRTQGHMFRDSYGYVCNSPDKENGYDLSHVTLTRHKCMFLYETYLTILFVCSFTMVFLIVVSLIYRFRWRLRFLVYTLQHRLTRERPSGPAVAPKYDVFVSYDSSDAGWVLRTLRLELEDRQGLRLCLHERDFTPGRYISDNIIEKMQESGAILSILSNAFLNSEWCRFELYVAIKSGLAHAQKRIPLVPLLLENLDRSAVDSFISTLLNTTTYLAWPQTEGEEERERFWRTLCQVLARDTGRELRHFPPERRAR